MEKNFNDLISHINDNFRFGTRIKQKVIDQWFDEYILEVEDRFAVYNEIESLQIVIVDLPSTVMKGNLFKLFKCIEREKEIKRKTLIEWFNQKNIDKNSQENILIDLEKKGFAIIEEKTPGVYEINFDIFDDFLESDLDSLLEDNAFLEHVASLEDVIDKSMNMEYLIQIQTGDELNRDRSLSNLVEANRKLVWKIVKHYSGLSTVGFDKNDMYQVGVIGLLKAAEKFDMNLGFQFSTYATWWIRQAITRGIADNSTLIRIPVHYRDKINKFMRIEKELWNELARPATTLELSKEMGESVEIIEEIRFYILQSNLDSLDRIVGEGGNTKLSELLLDDTLNTPDEEYTKHELRDVMLEIFQTDLTEREMEVIYHRFGFNNDEIKTLETVGQIFSVTRERIRQIEAKAIRKLQKYKTTELLKEYYYEY